MNRKKPKCLQSKIVNIIKVKLLTKTYKIQNKRLKIKKTKFMKN